jgi:hypothetical protein
MEVLQHEDDGPAPGQGCEEVPQGLKGLMADLLRGGVLEPQVPVGTKAQGEKVAQQRPDLVYLLRRQVLRATNCRRKATRRWARARSSSSGRQAKRSWKRSRKSE